MRVRGRCSAKPAAGRTPPLMRQRRSAERTQVSCGSLTRPGMPPCWASPSCVPAQTVSTHRVQSDKGGATQHVLSVLRA